MPIDWLTEREIQTKTTDDYRAGYERAFGMHRRDVPRSTCKHSYKPVHVDNKCLFRCSKCETELEVAY